MKTALITGTTSGIGKSTAIELSKHNMNLVLCGRREDRLRQLKEELEKKVNVHILCFDVRNQKQVFSSLSNMPPPFSTIDILINNAGNAHGLDPIQTGSLEDWDAMIDINVKGLLYVSKAIIPKMVAQKSGHIINIGSIAGKEVYPNGNVYCASKHAVDAINKGMLVDLNTHGIRVGAIHPGLVETEFSNVRFKNNDQKANNVYKGFDPLTPEDIADIIAFVVTRPYHVNISDLIVLPTAQANSTVVNKSF
ncbi:SDR family NAD(P)-dependent oxidoreductase [Aquimarina pacifica]|uniref:SDR family NAD(P)-dependent oxidoreductase n=1 Tax=Aquimarina pacifica TaxID=1296415 RepID=UPI00046E8A56|nr:SDR family NAD(P)-dependent oxidoreductase [Aquimarina pacifica]